jgi:hypothetical protein
MRRADQNGRAEFKAKDDGCTALFPKDALPENTVCLNCRQNVSVVNAKTRVSLPVVNNGLRGTFWKGSAAVVFFAARPRARLAAGVDRND